MTSSMVENDPLPDMKEIHSVNFSLLSDKELNKYTVVQITETKLEGPGSVFDERLGVLERDKTCVTCDQDYINCPGHFGRIELNVPIYHPCYLKEICSYLNCICSSCSRVVLSDDQFTVKGLFNYQGSNRFEMVKSESKGIELCQVCKEPHLKYALVEECIHIIFDKDKKVRIQPWEVEDIFSKIPQKEVVKLGFSNPYTHPLNMIRNTIPVLPPCARPYTIVGKQLNHDDLTYQYTNIVKINNKMKGKKSFDFASDEIEFQNLINGLYFNFKTIIDNSKGRSTRPNGGKPVKGIRERLTGKDGLLRHNLNGKRVDFCARTVVGPEVNCDTDEVGMPAEMARKLTTPIRVYESNRVELEELCNTGGALRYIRNNKIFHLNHIPDEKVVVSLLPSGGGGGTTPEEFKRFTLTDGDTITRKVVLPGRYEMNEINPKRYELIKGKKFQLLVGDVVRRKVECGGRYSFVNLSVDSITKKPRLNLKVGDIVERCLINGDYVLVNRQPTLHKGSMMTMRVKVVGSKRKTMTLNIAACTPFNADFDGDEMNIHVPQSEHTRAEAEEIVSVERNVMSSQSSRPLIKICQDALTAGYLLTQRVNPIAVDLFNDCCVSVPRWDFEKIEKKLKHIRRVCSLKGKAIPVYSGHSLFSMLLPDDFEYHYDNKAFVVSTTVGVGGEPITEPVVITRGVLVSGTVDISVLGNKQSSLISFLAKYYSRKVALDFVSDYQRVVTHWLLHRGFSVGIKDCIPGGESLRRSEGRRKESLFRSGRTVEEIFGSKEPSASDPPEEKVRGGEVTVSSQISHSVSEALLEIQGIIRTEKDVNFAEMKINGQLNRVQTIGDKLAKNSIPADNGLRVMISSGSKGNFVNITQILGILGQQNINGCRIPKKFQCRTLPHFKKYTSSRDEYLKISSSGQGNSVYIPTIEEIPTDEKFPDELSLGGNRPPANSGRSTAGDSKSDNERELMNIIYSRGFITSSYIKGLNPFEFFFHSGSGREGILDTATKTSNCGYISRKLVKFMERFTVSHHGTIIDNHSGILSFHYGNNGMEAGKLVPVGVPGEPLQFTNIAHIVNSLNTATEWDPDTRDPDTEITDLLL